MSGPDHHSDEWLPSERKSFRLALAITLLPIPAALLISWLMGDPPWRTRHDREAGRAVEAPSHLAPDAGRGHGSR